MSLINLIDAETGKKLIAQIDTDILPDITKALLEVVDRLTSNLKGLTITIRIQKD